MEIKEWEVPWKETLPRDPLMDKEGRVWFVEKRGDYIAYLKPDEGSFRRYDLDPGTGGDNLWFTIQGGNFVGRVYMS
ncbi:MAG: hypothetical protein PVJ36_06145 [Nitrospirota bacterium]